MKKIYLAILLILSLFIHREWFFSTSILAHGDASFFYREALMFNFVPPSFWSNFFYLGNVNVLLYTYPLDLLAGIFAHFGLNWEIILRIIYLLPIAILSFFSAFPLIKSHTKSDFAAFLGTIIYSFSTYMCLRRTDQYPLTLVFFLTPLIFFYFQKNNFIFGLLLYVASIYEFRIFYIVLGALFLYTFYIYFFIEKKNKILINYFLPVVVVFILHLWWIIPLSTLGSIQSNVIFNRPLFGNDLTKLSNVITIFYPFWNFFGPTVFEAYKIPFYYYLIPLLAFFGFYLNRKNKHLFFYALLSLLFIFLTKQIDFPFTQIYPFLYKYFPGFNAFREASKFYFIIILSYSLLIASLIPKIKTVPKILLTIFILAVFIANIFPFFTKSAATTFVGRNIPQDYIVLKNILSKDPSFYRTLYLPVSVKWGYSDLNHPIISTEDVLRNTFANRVGYSEINPWPTADDFIKVIDHKDFKKFLDYSSVKYIIIPIQDIENEDNVYANYKNASPEILELKLQKLTYLKKVAGFSKLIVYENSEYKPLIYKENGLVYFSQNFHKNWFLLEATDHYVSEFGLNVFKLKNSNVKISKPVFKTN